MKNGNEERSGSPRGGFTLIEILLVVVIIGILMGVALPRLGGRKRDAEMAAARATVENLGTALSLYELDNGEYPSTLQALVTRPANVSNWKGPYLSKGLPRDPWGQEYLYQYPGTHNPHGYDLSSSGPGGEGSEPINNWSH